MMKMRSLISMRIRTVTLAGLVVALAAAARPARAQTVHVSNDTNINLASPGQLNGTATSLFVRNIGSGGERHTYLQFDLSTVPSGVLINQALLRIWVLAVNDPGAVDVYVIDGAWDEETLSASVAPPLGALIGTFSLGASDQNRFALADITPTVQGWINGSTPNHGIALVPSSADPIRVTLDSKEATGTSHGPELEVAVIPTGDITSVGAGLGLTGGGTSDAVSLGLDTSFTDARYAAIAHGHTVSEIPGVATLGANTFNGSQAIVGNQSVNGLGSFVSNIATGTVLRADSTGAGGAVVAIRGTTLASNSAAIVGEANAASGFAAGVVGNSQAGVGVTGFSGGTSGYGVRGQASGVGGVGVYGQGQNGTFGSGVLGISEAANGKGVDARATATTGLNYGLSASTFSTDGTGIAAIATADTGSTFGLQAFVASPAGTGGRFQAPSGADLLQGYRSDELGPTATFRVDVDGVVYANSYRDIAGNPIPSGTGDITAVAAGTGLSGGAAAGDATLGLDTAFTDSRYAPTSHSHDVSQVTNAARLAANTFTATQTIDTGNLDLDPSTGTAGNITKNGAPFVHNFGTDNTFLGAGTGNFTMTGLGRNTALGHAAFVSNTTGQQNTAVGYGALASNTGGSSNIALGESVLRFNTTGGGNVAVGTASMQFNTTGAHNTASGHVALRANTSGSFNTAIGMNALEVNTTGASNTALGRSALGISNGNNNVALGSGAGASATTGSFNIYLGADVFGTAGESNTMYLGKVGTQTKTVIAGVRGTPVTGGEVVVIDAAGRLGTGAVAPGADTVGAAQVIDESLTASDLAPNSVSSSELTSGSVTADKVAFSYAGSASPGGAAADVACLGCIAASEVGFSFAALGANTFTATQTIDAGSLDLDASTATTGNITKNGQAFLHNYGLNNTFLGLNAGNLTMTGDSNTGSGGSALLNNTTGGSNTATGYFALRGNTTGGGNQASGNNALRNNVSGNANTANGSNALLNNTTGSANTAAGVNALLNSNGNNNAALGTSAGLNATNGSNNIYIGADVLGVAGESNTMYLGKVGTQTRTVIAGVRGVTTVNPDAIPVMIDSAGQLGTVSSSRRYKEDIRDMGNASHRLLQLRPVTFSYKQQFGGGSKPVQYGLIAEEVAEVFPELAVRGADGEIETVQYHTLSVLLLNEFQRLQTEAMRRENAIAAQRREMQRQEERIQLLERRLDQLLEQSRMGASSQER